VDPFLGPKALPVSRGREGVEGRVRPVNQDRLEETADSVVLKFYECRGRCRYCELEAAREEIHRAVVVDVPEHGSKLTRP